MTAAMAFACGAGKDARALAVRFGSRRQSEFETEQSVGAAFVEAQSPGLAEQREADRTDAAIIFRDRRILRNESPDPFDRAFE